MKFDRSRVFTALNADELKMGDKVIVAYNVASLYDYILDENVLEENLLEVQEIRPNTFEYRIVAGCESFPLAYLVKRVEKKWRPYKDCDEMVLDFCRRFVRRELNSSEIPSMWVMPKSKSTWSFVSELDFPDKEVCIGQEMRCNLTSLFENYIWLDLSPCGMEE